MNIKFSLLNNWLAKSIALLIAIVLVIFNSTNKLTERALSIPLEIIVGETLLPITAPPERVLIVIRGESELVNLLVDNDFRTFIDLSQEISAGMVTLPINLEKRNFVYQSEVLEINIEPSEITFELEEVAQKQVKIEPQFTGTLPAGFKLSEFRISPAIVEIVGPKSMVTDVEQARTTDISLLNRNTNFTSRVNLIDIGELISYNTDTLVEVRAIIEEENVTSIFNSVQTVVTLLPPQLTVGSALPNGSIRVQGRNSILQSIEPNQVQMILDASNISSPGKYSLRTKPVVPSGLLVIGYDPEVVTVDIVSIAQ